MFKDKSLRTQLLGAFMTIALFIVIAGVPLLILLYVGAANFSKGVDVEVNRISQNQIANNTTTDADLNLAVANLEKMAHKNKESVDLVVYAGFVIVGITVIMSPFFGNYFGRSVTRSLRRLQESSERIANGNFDQKITIYSKDEVGQLGRTFNRMAEHLRASYQRLEFEKTRDETLMESLGEGLLALDAKGKIVLVNRNALDLLELGDRDHVIGQTVTDLVTVAEQEDKHDKPVSHSHRPELLTLKDAQPHGDIFSFQRKSEDRKILVSINAYPVVQKGQSDGAIVVVRDVTKEREIDRMKTEFISLASHQLRTPLSAIKWFSEMLVNGDAGELSEEQLEFSKNISASAERMIDLVNSLLNISRIESGRIIVDPKPTDLQELVGGIINDLKAKTSEKEQTLIISVHKELGKINLDPRLIGQVYMNFLTNAIKYTPKGGEVSVFISRKGNEIVSQISDNGFGIPKAQQERVFQKFFRAENVAKVETDGTGLGLYLVKAIIESSGGRVWFESEEGKGTSFWFTLPASGMKAKAGEVQLDV